MIESVTECLRARLGTRVLARDTADAGRVLTLTLANGRESVLVALWEPCDGAAYATLPGGGEACVGTFHVPDEVGDADDAVDALWAELHAQERENRERGGVAPLPPWVPEAVLPRVPWSPPDTEPDRWDAEDGWE